MGGRVFWLFNFSCTAATALSNLSFGGRCKTRITIPKYEDLKGHLKYDFKSDLSITKN
jgi:hypothetical protein